MTTDIEKRLLALQKQVRAANLSVKPAEVTVLEPSFPKTEAEVLAKESEFFEKLFLPSLLSAAWLPRQGSRVMKHERAYGNLSIIVSTGYRKGLKPIYLPTGIIPRRILSALTTKAVVTQSRFVDVSSISALLKDMNLAINGPQIKRVQKQVLQLARSRVEINFTYRDPDSEKEKVVFFDGAIFRRLDAEIEETGQGRLIPNVIEFDPRFYELVLKGHAVPYSKQLYECSSSLTHDVFLWMERRFYNSDENEVNIHYPMLWKQFGGGKSMTGVFKQRIKESMKEVSKLLKMKVHLGKKSVTLHAPKRDPFGFDAIE